MWGRRPFYKRVPPPQNISKYIALAGDLSQGLLQKGQHGGIALVFALHIVHIPQHPHHVAPVAGLLEGPQAGGQAQRLDGCGAHNHHAPCAEARGSRPEGVGVGHKALVRAGGAVFRRDGHAGGPESVGSGRVRQILKQGDTTPIRSVIVGIVDAVDAPAGAR